MVMVLPLRGDALLGMYTQGVALGWQMAAPAGREWLL
jgi:hypothetical protein